MSLENIIFVIFLWIFFGFQHSFLAQKYFKDKLSKIIGKEFTLYSYRFFYTLTQSFVFVIIWFLISSINPGGIIFQLDEKYNLLIFLLKKISELFLLWSVLAIDVNYFIGLKQLIYYFQKKFYFKEKNLPAPKQIMTNSILYKFSRHPMYLAIVLNLLLSTTIYTEIFFINIFFLFLYIQIGIYFEERQLIKVHGIQYINYLKKTPKLFPFIKIKFIN